MPENIINGPIVAQMEASAAIYTPPPVTASVDAALAFMRAQLPGSEYELLTIHSQAYANLPLNGPSTQSSTRSDGNMPIATLRAKQAEMNNAKTNL
jgi:hypothetical protein